MLALMRTALCVLAFILPMSAAFSQQPGQAVCPTHSEPPPRLPGPVGGSLVAYQQFPPSGPMQTAWYVTYDHAVAQGLFLTSAYFKPGPTRPWVKILGRAGLSELFVPYQSGSPRFHDLSDFSFDLVPATAADAGPCGRLVGRQNKVVREVVDKGPLWKNDGEVYRGHKMLLWATLDAENYNYIISYGLHDDGNIEFRIAGTAVNLPSKPREAHVHNAIWRIDVDLDGPEGDTVSVSRHQETTQSNSWQDVHEPFNGAREGAANFAAGEFTTLHITDAKLKNGNGQTAGYMLNPLVRGVARHREPYMQNDFWVTRANPGELSFREIRTFANNESIQNTDVVVWHVTPVLHIPRDEDGQDENGTWRGVALAMWTGFDMKPHNLFDTTPFYPAPE